MPMQLTIPKTEMWDPVSRRFYDVKEQTITLEHSLVSLSKWESKWKKPLIGNSQLTMEQFLDYCQCMTFERNVDPLVYKCLTTEQLLAIQKYMDDPMTATWFADSDDEATQSNSKSITSELIYYWMFASGISKECEKWHLNRLITLIHVTSEENKPRKKRTDSERMAHHRKLLKSRRAKRKHN